MPEMLTPTSVIYGAGLAKDVALITDGRFSGASQGFIIGHVCPEAQEGGTIALLQDGDAITIDSDTHRIDVDLSDGELEARRAAWTAPADFRPENPDFRSPRRPTAQTIADFLDLFTVEVPMGIHIRRGALTGGKTKHENSYVVFL